MHHRPAAVSHRQTKRRLGLFHWVQLYSKIQVTTCPSFRPILAKNAANFAFVPRRENIKKLLDLYYSKLSSKLSELGHDPSQVYPVEEFKKDFRECRAFGYAMSLMHAMVRAKQGYPMPAMSQ